MSYSDPTAGGSAAAYFAKLLERLGIAGAVNAKASLGRNGHHVAELVADGVMVATPAAYVQPAASRPPGIKLGFIPSGNSEGTSLPSASSRLWHEERERVVNSHSRRRQA